MKKIGIIGGLGPEATIDYYKEIIKEFNSYDKEDKLNYPEIIIYSVNLSRLVSYFENKEFDKAVGYISDKVNMLYNAGADFAAISANTPHLLFGEIEKKSKIPLISIVEATKEAAHDQNLKKSGLFGTKFTMNATFYKDIFKKQNMEIIVPQPKEIEIINNIVFQELELGIFKEETKQKLLSIVEQMIERENIDSLILGCTEFPIMFPDDNYLNIPFLNTTKIHVKKIIEKCLT